MPIPFGSLIAGGASLLGSGLNAISTGIQNRRSQNFSRDMYRMQLNDNIKLWNMQNEYNSPVNQVKRLKEANLNPALLYGSGASGASGSAGAVSRADVKNPHFNTPDLSGIGMAGIQALNNMYALEKQKVEVDNMKKQGKVLQQEALVKAASAVDLAVGADRKKFDLSQESKLAQVSIDYRKALLDQVTSNIQIARNVDHRAGQLHKGNITKQAIGIALDRIKAKVSKQQFEVMKQQIINMAKDAKLKDWEINLNKMGFSKNDTVQMRVASTWANRILQALGVEFNN